MNWIRNTLLNALNYPCAALMWLCSKTARDFWDREKAEKTPARIAEENGLTMAQAFALVWSRTWEPLRPALARYREPAES